MRMFYDHAKTTRVTNNHFEEGGIGNGCYDAGDAASSEHSFENNDSLYRSVQEGGRYLVFAATVNLG